MPKILANAHESFTTTAQSRVQRLHPRGCSPRLRRHPMGTMHLVSLRRTSSERSSGSLSEGLCLNSNPAPPSASTMSLLALLQACLLAANSVAILNEERFLDPSASSSPPLLLLEQLVSTFTLGHPQTGGATQHCSITPRFIALSRARSSAPFTPSAIFAVRPPPHCDWDIATFSLLSLPEPTRAFAVPLIAVNLLFALVALIT